MKTLYLLRHAKSNHANPLLKDRDRDLNERGRRACGLIGRHMAKIGFFPDLILSSAAARALETSTLVSEAMGRDIEIEAEDDLYLAEPATILDHALGAPDSAGTLMIVGHNPGFAALAFALAGRAPIPPKLSAYPTAALAVFKFEAAHWTDLDPTAATLEGFVTPRELEAV